MSGFRRRDAIGLMIAVVLVPAGSFSDTAQQEALSPRNANYTIEVRLNPVTKTLVAKEVVAWRNDTAVPAKELWFHLYWNAWKNNKSTWLRENVYRQEEPLMVAEEDYSYIEVNRMRVLASGPFQEATLTDSMRYESPDDANPDDETVLVAPLPRPVKSGETIKVEIIWESKIPRAFRRTGYRRNYFFIAQWFPKLGVYEADGSWNCHQFHAATEFFSDFGIYDVKMTVPANWKVGATGLEVAIETNGDGTSTHHYHQADVHDFAWTTSPDYLEARSRFEHPGLKAVEMRLLYQPEHESQLERHFRAAAATLKYYGTWYGEYPYGHITLIDPAWKSGAGGMEYPTLFTCGTRYFAPAGGGMPEGVTVHELGHQFWYGIVANNEFEHAWLDEGLNTFSTLRTMKVAFGGTSYVQRFFHDFFPVIIPEIVWRVMVGNRLEWYRQAARSDVQATPTYRYFPKTAGRISYHKTHLWLATLERLVGWETLREIVSTFFERWKFRHPTPEDFFAVANEVSDQDLTYFFDEVYRKAAVFDYSVQSVSSKKLEPKGFFKDQKGNLVYRSGQSTENKLYETQVVVRRLQDGILPVEVLLKFENGEEVRDVWDGKALWKLYTVVKPTKLVYATVDPQLKILLDVNYTNNSQRLVSQASFPAGKWASRWMIWLQDYMQTLSFLF